MHILLCNDDGIEAKGLAALERALAPLGTLWTVAPAREQSAQSHALTLHKPLRAIPAGERRWAVSGTPADCAYVGVHYLLPIKPSIVVSGINKGGNLGSDVHYSGTVAAAREACLAGFKAVAISLDYTGAGHWETAEQVARQVVALAMTLTLPEGVYLNVNVPDVPLEGHKGLKAASALRRAYDQRVEPRRDPRGKEYLWIGGPAAAVLPDPESDEAAVAAGYASVSALSCNITHPDTQELLREQL